MKLKEKYLSTLRQTIHRIRQLKGHKHLILGNCDIKIQLNDEAMSYFESIDQIKIIKDAYGVKKTEERYDEIDLGQPLLF